MAGDCEGVPDGGDHQRPAGPPRPHLPAAQRDQDEHLGPLPDLLRLLRRLAADRNLPWTIRARIAFLMIYLVSPIDLMPDVVPVFGYADDAIIVTPRPALRRPPRRSRRRAPALARHRGRLTALRQLTGLTPPDRTSVDP